MRQVPHYLIIGNGRLATHFKYYFNLLKLSYSSWSRAESIETLTDNLKSITHILILISDDAIDDFIVKYLAKSTAIKIHCSGQLNSKHAFGAHPLSTFSLNLYPFEQYMNIPFIVDSDAPDFTELLPGLPNPHVRLEPTLKAKYHALCVLGGNFSCMLWQKLFASFENELNIPANIAYPYLQQQTTNLLNHYQAALTGPLVRGDWQTINNNLYALANDPFKSVYESFINCYQHMQREIKK